VTLFEDAQDLIAVGSQVERGVRLHATDASVLDVCCGSRMMWFDKADGRALFLDKRREVTTDPRGAEIVVNPDMVANFTALPFDDNSFSLVVFDPPHTFNGTDSAMAKKYGTLAPGWREEITRGFAECFRVLKPSGTLVFKWNEHRVPVSTVLAMTPEKPLFGHRSGAAARTHWLVFMKPNVGAKAPA
jgi:ubiquinone/menaquinone biosynthesis C-methylase UbiE